MSNTNMVLGSWRLGEWPEYVTVSHEGMCEVGRRYVPERTCRDVYPDTGWFQCSECGAFVGEYGVTNATSPIPITFCPNCGAKVVE